MAQHRHSKACATTRCASIAVFIHGGKLPCNWGSVGRTTPGHWRYVFAGSGTAAVQRQRQRTSSTGTGPAAGRRMKAEQYIARGAGARPAAWQLGREGVRAQVVLGMASGGAWGGSHCCAVQKRRNPPAQGRRWHTPALVGPAGCMYVMCWEGCGPSPAPLRADLGHSVGMSGGRGCVGTGAPLAATGPVRVILSRASFRPVSIRLTAPLRRLHRRRPWGQGGGR